VYERRRGYIYGTYYLYGLHKKKTDRPMSGVRYPSGNSLVDIFILGKRGEDNVGNDLE
jgi:hypothetical protein